MVSCSCSRNDKPTDTSATITLDDESPELAHAPSSVLDSLALNADDLTPAQAVNLLLGYVDIQKNATSFRTKIITMRKFVDVYDIVMNNYGDEFRSVIRKAADRDNGVDLKEISLEFRDKLANYEEGSGTEYSTTAPKDSTATNDSIAAQPQVSEIQ